MRNTYFNKKKMASSGLDSNISIQKYFDCVIREGHISSDPFVILHTLPQINSCAMVAVKSVLQYVFPFLQRVVYF